MKLANRANAEIEKADLESARRDLEAAIRLAPEYWPALYTRGTLFLKQGKYDLALQDANHVLRQDSTVVEAALLRGQVNIKLRKYAATLHDPDNIIHIQPRRITWAVAFQQRAMVFAICQGSSIRNLPLPLRDATTACKMTGWKDASMIDTLAFVHGELGDFDSAIRYEQQAIRFGNGTPRESQSFRKQLGRLTQHRPSQER